MVRSRQYHRSHMNPTDPTSLLDSSQLRSFSAFQKKKCLAILGGAGTGKSYLLSIIIEEARRQSRGRENFAVCAMSNQAASSLGGTTIHALLGAPPWRKFSHEALWTRIRRSDAKMKRLRAIEILIIDEVAVVPANVLDALDFVMRNLAPSDRLSSIPFGGRQLVVAGDPFQLEPITAMEDEDEPLHAFSSRSWFLVFGGFGSGVVSVLKGNHRQRRDGSFHCILNRIRVGKATKEDIDLLNETSEGKTTPPKECTILCLKKAQVNMVNEKALLSISGTSYCFEARDVYLHERSEELNKRLAAVSQHLLHVKLGCHLLVTRKISDLLPGTRVVAQKIVFKGSQPVSIMVRVQGSPEDSHLREMYPVNFHTYADDGSVAAYRTQLPLISAYAITVHRSQGLTLSSVAMDFSFVQNWKPNGMVYVALSRCKSLSGLWVRGLRLNHIKISPTASNYMRKLTLLRQQFPYKIIGAFEPGRTLVCGKRVRSTSDCEKENMDPNINCQVRRCMESAASDEQTRNKL